MFLGAQARKAGLACSSHGRRVEHSSVASYGPSIGGHPLADHRQVANNNSGVVPPSHGPELVARTQILPNRRASVCAAQPAASAGLFPAGKQQARVELPALMLHVEAANVQKDDVLTEALSKAVSGGANSVVLWEGGAGAAALYDAALKLKEVLRGRANLLLVDRTDIAIAAAAEGVLLTDQGVRAWQGAAWMWLSPA